MSGGFGNRLQMKTMITSRILLAVTLLCANISDGKEKVTPPAPIDATLYTTYYFVDSTHTSANWFTCGSLPNSAGCYGSGSLGSFGKVGTMMEGNPRTNLSTKTVTRAIYVLDVAAGTTQDQVVLNVYKKTDVITPDSDTVTVTFARAITLSLTGGSSATALMAANTNFLLVGTSRSAAAVEVDKRTFDITQFGTFPTNLSSITADQYGYITAAFDDSEFFAIGPDGTEVEGGGGSQFMLNTVQGVPARFP
jgi:hypothetical protein